MIQNFYSALSAARNYTVTFSAHLDFFLNWLSLAGSTDQTITGISVLSLKTQIKGRIGKSIATKHTHSVCNMVHSKCSLPRDKPESHTYRYIIIIEIIQEDT